jgi:hypothetical protein
MPGRNSRSAWTKACNYRASEPIPASPSPRLLDAANRWAVTHDLTVDKMFDPEE